MDEQVQTTVVKPGVPTMPSRRLFSGSLLASTFIAGLAASGGRASAVNVGFWPGCDLNLSQAAFRAQADWDRVYLKNWGPLGRQSQQQINTVVHAVDGIYDDLYAPFAWIVHYWIRAWVTMADLTGDRKYMDTCVSFIDYMFDNTDARRVARGEMKENYIRDPIYLKGTGNGGPFWSRQQSANVLETGQVVRGIMTFVDAVFEDQDRWRSYGPTAFRYFEAAIIAADAFDNDWQSYGEMGSYHYRDSSGSGNLGTTPTAFNQSATMVAAQLLIHKWRPDRKRAEKVRRLAQFWIDRYAVPQSDGALTWRYILIPGDTSIEDAGHAAIDLDFLIPAYRSGLTNLTLAHMNGLSKTFLQRLYNGSDGLNRSVDGRTGDNYADHFNAGFGWLELARFAPEIASTALKIYDRHYPPVAPAGIIWAQPMLGWANLLMAGRAC